MAKRERVAVLLLWSVSGIDTVIFRHFIKKWRVGCSYRRKQVSRLRYFGEEGISDIWICNERFFGGTFLC